MHMSTAQTGLSRSDPLCMFMHMSLHLSLHMSLHTLARGSSAQADGRADVGTEVDVAHGVVVSKAVLFQSSHPFNIAERRKGSMGTDGTGEIGRTTETLRVGNLKDT